MYYWIAKLIVIVLLIMLCSHYVGDRENATPPPQLTRVDSSQSTGAQSKVFSPMVSKSYTVQHGPTYTTHPSPSSLPSAVRSVYLYTYVYIVHVTFLWMNSVELYSLALYLYANCCVHLKVLGIKYVEPYEMIFLELFAPYMPYCWSCSLFLNRYVKMQLHHLKNQNSSFTF